MNVVADALSRRDTEATAELAALSAPSFSIFDDLCREHEADPALKAIKDEIEQGVRAGQWGVVDNLVTFGGRVYVSRTSPSIPAIMAAAHGAGH